jgi:hypothetical protein
MPAVRRCLALMHLFRRQGLSARGDGPAEAEWVGDDAVAVTPELVCERHHRFATGGGCLRENRVGVGNIHVQRERPNLQQWVMNRTRESDRSTSVWNHRYELRHA